METSATGKDGRAGVGQDFDVVERKLRKGERRRYLHGGDGGRKPACRAWVISCWRNGRGHRSDGRPAGIAPTTPSPPYGGQHGPRRSPGPAGGGVRSVERVGEDRDGPDGGLIGRPAIGPRLFGYLRTPSMALADGQGLRLREDQRARERGAERQRPEEERRQEGSRAGGMKIQPCRAIRNRTRRAAIVPRQGDWNGGISVSQTGRQNAVIRRVNRHRKVANGGCCFRDAFPAISRSVRYELVNGVPE